MSVDTISEDTLGVLIKLLGPEAVAAMTRPLTAQELADLEAGLARHDGDPVAAGGFNVDETTAAFLRALPIGGVTR